jgi:lipoprotein
MNKQAEERKVMPLAHLWFACRHLGCLAFSTQSHCSFMNKTNNMPNKQAKAAQISTTDWGLI